jgi:hypothetical protein
MTLWATIAETSVAFWSSRVEGQLVPNAVSPNHVVTADATEESATIDIHRMGKRPPHNVVVRRSPAAELVLVEDVNDPRNVTISAEALTPAGLPLIRSD